MQKFYRIDSKFGGLRTKGGLAFGLLLLLPTTMLNSQCALAADSAKLDFDPTKVTSWPIDLRNSIQLRLMQDRLIEVKQGCKELEIKLAAANSSAFSASSAKKRAEKELARLKAKLAAMAEANPGVTKSAAAAEERAQSAERRVTELQVALEQKSNELADGRRKLDQLAVRVAELKRSNLSLIANMSNPAPLLGSARFSAQPTKNPTDDKLNAWYLRQANQKIMDAVHREGNNPPVGTVCFTIAPDGCPVIAAPNDGTAIDPDTGRAVQKIERLVRMAGPYHPLLGETSNKVLQLAFKYSVEDDKPSVSMHLAMKPSAVKE